MFLFSSVSLFLLIFSLVVYLFIKKKISYRNVFLIVLTFYVFFFQHHALKFSIINIGNQYNSYAAEISFLIILIISGLLSYLVFKDKIFIKKILYIFFIFLFSFNLLNFTKNFLNLEKDKNYINKKIIFEDKLKKKKENIYFFILDAMGPIDKFDKYYNLNSDYFLSYTKTKNYNYFLDTKNFYETTDQNLSVIFHLDTLLIRMEAINIMGHILQFYEVVFPSQI